MKIESIKARMVLDSRGNPTVEVDVKTKSGFGRATAPSGASKGVHEVLELRDGGKEWHGKGVKKAIENVNKIIAPALKGMDASEQEEIDRKMIKLDGTENKSKFGANAIVATSMAVLKAAANSKNKQVYEYLGGKLLPIPMLNVINGGEHAGNDLAIQEFMLFPANVNSFSEAMQAASEIYQQLKADLVKKYGKSAKNVGDEGGFAPNMKEVEEAFEILVRAIEETGYSKKVFIAIDSAATSFYENGKYRIDGKTISAEELLELYKQLTKTYPIKSIEDPFYEEDFESFAELNREIGKRVQIVGDDLVVTNPKRIKIALEKNSMNALLLKVNQIGTVTEAIEAAEMLRKRKMNVVVSHRSGETEDTFISHFVVGKEYGMIKSGAPARGERTAKYNELLRIEELVGNNYARFKL
ncbi:MAG: phosphopyruvate hydratase [Candidatus Anstonellales archaeon]